MFRRGHDQHRFRMDSRLRNCPWQSLEPGGLSSEVVKGVFRGSTVQLKLKLQNGSPNVRAAVCARRGLRAAKPLRES